MRTHLVIAASAILFSPLVALAATQSELPNPILETAAPQSEVSDVPEPSSLFFAGIGSLAILFFAIRRK